MAAYLLQLLGLLVLASIVVCCPNGFIQHDDSCYKVFPEHATWPEAESYCRDFGLTLAKVESQREHDFLKGYVKTLSALHGAEFWLDGSDLLSGDWIWASTGKPITQFFWSPGEPSNDSPGEHCLSMRNDLNWDDEHCSLTRAFVCEVDASIDPGQLFG